MPKCEINDEVKICGTALLMRIVHQQLMELFYIDLLIVQLCETLLTW